MQCNAMKNGTKLSDIGLLVFVVSEALSCVAMLKSIGYDMTSTYH